MQVRLMELTVGLTIPQPSLAKVSLHGPQMKFVHQLFYSMALPCSCGLRETTVQHWVLGKLLARSKPLPFAVSQVTPS